MRMRTRNGFSAMVVRRSEMRASMRSVEESARVVESLQVARQ
jgi:hypothetical protein